MSIRKSWRSARRNEREGTSRCDRHAPGPTARLQAEARRQGSRDRRAATGDRRVQGGDPPPQPQGDRVMRSLIVLVSLFVALAGPASAQKTAPPPYQPLNPIAEYALGIGAFVGTALWWPVKVAWGAFSLTVLGPVNLCISAISVDLPKPVIRCLVGGDYTVSTDHLMGRDQLHFTGCSPLWGKTK